MSWPLRLFLAALWGCSPAWAQAPAGMSSQAELGRWWSAAGHIWLDESAYQIETPLDLRDGVCSARMSKGIVIPVWAGKPPLSERIVGFVFIGRGELSVEIPERADRWRIANHAARFGLLSEPEQAAIAHGEADWRHEVDRGLILSADPKVRSVLAGLRPIGGGAAIRDHGAEVDGIDEAYIITDSRSNLRVRAIATNLLPQRRLQLERAGLDPRIWLRQDRLLVDVLGVEGEAARFLADWRTTRGLRVAAEQPVGISNDDHDRWLGCFRDPMDQEGLGFESLAFAHGTDGAGQRHFERMSGRALALPEDRPGAWMEARSAELTVLSRPKGTGNERFVEVEGTIELVARGGPARGLTLAMPVGNSMKGSFELVELATMDKQPLPRVSLAADLFGRQGAASVAARAPDTLLAGSEEGAGVDASSTDGSEGQGTASSGATGLGAPGGTPSSGNTVASSVSEPTISTELSGLDAVVADMEAAQGIGAAAEDALVRNTPVEFLIQAVLPTVVPEGEAIKLRFRWKARWPFANWTNQNRSLGSTTGMQPLLPRPVPSPGGARWNHRTRVGVPSGGLATIELAISGETLKEWAEESWFWSESQGHRQLDPSLAIGRWQAQLDPPGQGLPAIRALLFNGDAWALPMFPPELRRVVSYLERFLPDFPEPELDVWQGPALTVLQASRGERPEAGAGLVQVQTIKPLEVTDATRVGDEDPYLMQGLIARQVASQYWGQRITPLSSRDEWLTTGLSEAYASFYIRSAFGPTAYEERMTRQRKAIEDPPDLDLGPTAINQNRRFLSLTGSTPASDTFAPLRRQLAGYLLADSFRLRMGDRAFFAALDQLARRSRDGSVSTLDLQAALQEASGTDFSDEFDFFVNGGFMPELRLETRVVGSPDGRSRVQGCVRSDIPWGRFSVPVEVRDRGGERSVSALVQIVDGVGRFEVPDRQADAKVLLDPLGFVPARSRRVQEINREPCAPER